MHLMGPQHGKMVLAIAFDRDFNCFTNFLANSTSLHTHAENDTKDLDAVEHCHQCGFNHQVAHCTAKVQFQPEFEQETRRVFDLGGHNIVDGLFTISPPLGCLAATRAGSSTARHSTVRAGSSSR